MEEQIEEYVKTYLNQELSEFSRNNANINYPQLTIYEKIVIYKYTEDGFRTLNARLRSNNGSYLSKYGQYLKFALDKIPNHLGIVYRGVNLSKGELAVYEDAFKNKKIITEAAFLSTTKSILIANMFRGNTLFTILSKKGKSIEDVSKYGQSQNEKEVLFEYKSKFKVLDFTKNGNLTLIQLEEM